MPIRYQPKHQFWGLLLPNADPRHPIPYWRIDSFAHIPFSIFRLLTRWRVEAEPEVANASDQTQRVRMSYGEVSVRVTVQQVLLLLRQSPTVRLLPAAGAVSPAEEHVVAVHAEVVAAGDEGLVLEPWPVVV